MNFDVFLVGVGGQGVLTLGELIAEAAIRRGIPANFYPTKGMAQRGGFVKAQLRMGREVVGPNIPEKGADLVIAMERSEALKAVRYVKPGRDFLLFGAIWAPTAVMLGKASYPSLAQVIESVEKTAGRVCHVEPASLPRCDGVVAPANVFLLGAAVGHTALGEVLGAEEVLQVVRDRWKRGADRNVCAYRAGLELCL